MDYTGTPSEKAVTAGELDRGHVGQTISFQPNEFTVVHGRIAGIAHTEAQVYLSLEGVGGGTHLKDEYDLPNTQEVYLQLDPLATAEKGLADAGKLIRDKVEEIAKNLGGRDKDSKPESEEKSGYDQV
ncbi:hypothetical protein [Arthrobacter sp. M4]|uniref:hypothetical protein n=1 Tax=Arthrobacter sp. M4 TaxID=218160 RepID=UPI001CDC52CA|nr:hypothetical protein [Arthrobacter sp. M4]MCA4134420.1 hypothetical protein [Arthrobacter sp. M4]